MIPFDLAVEPDLVRHDRRDLRDALVLACTNIDVFCSVIVVEQMKAGIRHVVDVEKLAPRRPAAPVHD